MRVHCDNHHCAYATSGGRCKYPSVTRPSASEKDGCERVRVEQLPLQ
ncbi:MAG: hypothetical protein Q8S19_09115 [Bacillota bacterium]|nr:hypothetical protein [Bacillota bacterium]